VTEENYFFLVVAFFVVDFFAGAAFLAGAFFAMALLPPFCPKNVETSTFSVNVFFQLHFLFSRKIGGGLTTEVTETTEKVTEKEPGF
jgi:hypothetical protein